MVRRILIPLLIMVSMQCGAFAQTPPEGTTSVEPASSAPGASSPQADASEAPTPDRVAPFSAAEIVERSYAALGGRRALADLRAYRLEGHMEGLSGFPGSFTLFAAAPDRRRVDWDIGYISQSWAFDGSRGWQRNASVRDVVGDELQRMQRASQFLPILALPQDVSSLLATEESDAAGTSRYVIHFTGPTGLEESLSFDTDSFLPVRESRQERFEEGPLEVSVNYLDYRRVGRVMMPFRIEEARPDLSFLIDVQSYRLNPSHIAQQFQNPNRAHEGDPYEVTLATIPQHVYLEGQNIWAGDWRRFWGMPYPDSNVTTLNVLVNERYGRFVDPVLVQLDFYRGDELVHTNTYHQNAMHDLRRFPATRFAPQPEIYDFRHDLSEPAQLGIDRIVYTFEGRDPQGRALRQTLNIPLEHYQQRHRLIFPIRGNFIVVNGHESYELDHKYEWSQHYAYDIVGLGPDLQLLNPDGSFFAFGRAEVIAPAAGTIVFARNDVPDGRVKREYLRMANGKWAIGGNIVLIDHGDGEYSLLAHMQQGSVRVRIGDHVEQGQVIGLMGMSGSPGHVHLHYQLQSSADLFTGDGLPSHFDNVTPRGWFEGVPLRGVRRGVYLQAQ